MITPWDKEYNQTKKIVQGKSNMNPFFVPLAEWIDETYNVKTRNIIYDTIKNVECEDVPRLQVCFEFEREKFIFDKEGHSFDPIKQKAIGKRFAKLIENKHSLDFSARNVWVVFSAFDRVAKMEANSNIPERKIKKLKKEIDNPDIWKIVRGFLGVTFFVYSDKQLKDYEEDSITEVWKARFFEILKEYDEFDYFKLDSFGLFLDSKENFDTNYESNWYYYFK